MTLIQSISTGMHRLGSYLQEGCHHLVTHLAASPKIDLTPFITPNEDLRRFIELGGGDKTKKAKNDSTIVDLEIFKGPDLLLQRFLELSRYLLPKKETWVFKRVGSPEIQEMMRELRGRGKGR